MNKVVRFVSVIIWLSLAACQQTGDSAQNSLPTLMPTLVPATATMQPPPSRTLSVTPSATETMTASPTVTPSATITSTFTASAPTATATASATASMTPTIAPSATRQRPPLPDVFSFGQSVQGRDLVAQRFGSGGALILLVGGIHTGFESNTVTLVEQMVAHYAGSPGAVLPGVTLVLVPALNPDGRTFGREVRGRFNANNVDLNRNWGCEWEPVAEFGEGQVNPGAAPFSEPETLMLAALINDLRPDVVVFYHSAANGVFPGRCDDVSNGEALAQIYAAASNYPFRESFDEYEVTGSAPDWVDSLGIPALDVELATADLSELGRNLDGVVALQCWLMGEAASVYTACLR